MGKVGFALIAIGVSLADSDLLIIPLAITGLGCYMIWRGGYVK